MQERWRCQVMSASALIPFQPPWASASTVPALSQPSPHKRHSQVSKRKNQSNGIWIVGLPFLAVGFFFIFYGIINLSKTCRFLETSAKVKGVVIGFNCGHSAKSSCSAKVRFTDRSGLTQTFEVAHESPSPWFKTGTEVHVWYPLLDEPYSNSHQDPRLDGFIDLWGGTLFSIMFGAPFFCAGLFMCHTSQPSQRKYRRKSKKVDAATSASEPRQSP